MTKQYLEEKAYNKTATGYYVRTSSSGRNALPVGKPDDFSQSRATRAQSWACLVGGTITSNLGIVNSGFFCLFAK